MSTTTLPADVRRIYTEARRTGYGAAESLRGARVLARWEDEEAAGRVRMRIEPDDDPAGSLSFLDLPEWSEEGGREAAAAGRKVRDLAEREGVWVAVPEALVPACESCRRGESWEAGDALGGLIGDPETEDGLPFAYRADLAASALDLLDRAGRPVDAGGESYVLDHGAGD